MRKTIVPALLALILALMGCSVQEIPPAGVRVYCMEETVETGRRLVYTRLELNEDDSREACVAAILRAMVLPGSDFSSALPWGIAPTLAFQGAVVRVEFTAEFDTLPDTQKSLAVAALSLSLLELPDVNYIYITAGGKPQPPFFDRAISRSSFITEEDALRYFS